MSRPDPFAPIKGATGRSASRKPALAIVMPVPPDAPSPPAEHFKLGKPTARWTYTDSNGATIGYVCRFDPRAGEKEFRPLTLWRPAGGGPPKWRWESWPAPRPLYGLRRLAERRMAPVMVVEGERAADAAAGLLPGFVVVTSPNGSKSADKADWSPLRGRSVVIWPDADAAGLDYAAAVAKAASAAGAISVATVAPPVGVAVGWDAADAAAQGWDTARAAALTEAAKSIDTMTPAADQASSGMELARRRRTPQRDVLLGLTEAAELWHDADRNAFATFPVNGHAEHWPIRSREFRMWLSCKFYEATGGALGGNSLDDAMRILEAQAINDGTFFEPFTRVGRQDGKLFLDLCDERWRAIEITAGGWRIVDHPGVKLLRSASMRALPEPEAGGMIEELRRFFNVRSDEDFQLSVAWLVAAMRDRGPYPVLVINGEQGAGKSFFSRMVRSLIDPNAAPIRAMPKDERDLIVSAGNSWALVFDNLSNVPGWFSDTLCRLATGGGFSTRMLHTDREEIIFAGSRPIVLNGIPSLTDRADLADRAITIHLATLGDEARASEEELIAAFEAKRPAILGALLDAVSAAVRNVNSVKIERAPRMADFVKWVTAAEPGLGWEPGEILAAYRENRRDVIESSFEADSVGVAINDHVAPDCPDGWIGTATQLLAVLNARVSEGVRKSKLWPLSAQALGNRIDRVAPLLRNKGFVVERRHSGQRLIIIKPPPKKEDRA